MKKLIRKLNWIHVIPALMAAILATMAYAVAFADRVTSIT